MDEPVEKREPLRIAIPGPDMTPGPPGGVAESAPSPGASVAPMERYQPNARYRSYDTNLPSVPEGEAGEEIYQNLTPGRKFTDHAGKTFTKPWEVHDDEDYEKVPEGAQFVDSEGNKFTRPKSKPLSFTAQAAYETAQTPEAKEKALRIIYGDKVKRFSSGELYVDDEGTIRRPGVKDVGTFAATFAASTPPALGMVGGSLLGGASGGPVGAYEGMVGGAALGRQFNNTMLSLFGVHQSIGEQVSSDAWEGAGAAIGEPIGKAVSAIPGAVKGVKDYLKETPEKLRKKASDVAGGALGSVLESVGVAPQLFRKFSGTTAETAKQASDIAGRVESDAAARGVKPQSPLAPDIMFPELPLVEKIQRFDEIFRKQNVFEQARTVYADQERKRIVEHDLIGIELKEPFSQATKRPSAQRAGQLAIEAARRDLAHDDAVAHEIARDIHRSTLMGLQETAATHQARVQALEATNARIAANSERLIRGQAAELRAEVDRVMALAGHNEDASAGHRLVAAGFDAYDTGVRARARTMYNAARAVTRGAPPPNVGPLATRAEAFLRSMPESMRARYPSEIADLARLLDRDIEIPGLPGRRALPQGETQQPLDWAGLHHLRSWLRHGIDYNDMTPDMQQGALKRFEQEVNRVLHDPNAPPQLRDAALLLDQADAFYRENIPFLNDQMVKTVMKELESGTGVDTKVVAHLLFDPKHTESLRRARRILGENTWRTVEAAHVQNMLRQSETLVPGQYNFSRFAAQVEEQVQNGIIETAYDPEMARRLRQLAIQMGQFKGDIPIEVGATDTLSMIMREGAATKAAITQAAETDPIKALQAEMKRYAQESGRISKETKAKAQSGPLGFLYQDKMSEMLITAGEKIIENPDLLRIASNYFKQDSPEWKAIQQVAVQRWFQRSVGDLGKMFEELPTAKGMTEETQALLFPGITRDMMVQFAKDMKFLVSGQGGSDVGASMAGGSRVLQPGRQLGAFGKATATWPFISSVHRFVLGKAYAFTVDALAHPQFAHWLAETLKTGTPEARAAAREVVQERLKTAGMIGAAAGQRELSGPSSPYMQQPEQPEPPEPPQQNQGGGNQIPGRQSSLSQQQGQVLSDADPDPIRPGAQYAAMLPEDRRSPHPGRVVGEGSGGGGEPTPMRTAGAQRGEPGAGTPRGTQRGVKKELDKIDRELQRMDWGSPEYNTKMAERSRVAEGSATSKSAGSFDQLRSAYDAVKGQQKISTVAIKDVIDKSGLSKEEVHSMLRDAAKEGKVSLHRTNVAGDPNMKEAIHYPDGDSFGYVIFK